MSGPPVKSELPWLRRDTNLSFALAILGVIAVAVLVHSTVISLIAVVSLVTLAALRPAASVVAIPATVGFVLEPVHVRGLEFSPQEVLLVTTVAGIGLNVLLSGWQESPIKRLTSFVTEVRRSVVAVDATAFLFLLVGVVSLFTLALPAYRHESIRDFRWTILEPVIFFGLARWYLKDQHNRRLAVTLFVGGATLVAISGIVSLISGHALSVEGVSRVSGVYDHPNALALFLERPFVLCVGMSALFRKRIQWYWLAPAAIVGVVLVMTFSRGAVLAAGLSVIAILLLGRQLRLAALATGAGAILAAGLAITASARIDNLFSGGSGSLRIDLWKSSIQMIRDHPIFGIGPDQFLYVYAPRYIKPQAWSERFTSHPHDIILDIWLRLGIMGVVLALAYLAILAWMTVGIMRRRRTLGLAAAGALLVGMLHGLVDNGYFLPDLALLFWFLTALVTVEAQDDSSETALLT